MDVSVGLLQLLRDVRKKRDKKGLFSDTSFLKKKGIQALRVMQTNVKDFQSKETAVLNFNYSK